MSDDDELVILGAPYVFARQKLRKPAHIEVVTLTCRPVLCHNACGLYYATTAAEPGPDDVCPDCGAAPKPWRTGEPEEVEVVVHVAFGNLVDVNFLRSRGKVTQRVFGGPSARGIVKPPPG